MNVEDYVVAGNLINEIRACQERIDDNANRRNEALEELNNLLKDNGQQEVTLSDVIF